MECMNAYVFFSSVLKKGNVNNSLVFILKQLSLKEVSALNMH